MQPGEKRVFVCPHCTTRFLVMLEPSTYRKIGDNAHDTRDFAPTPVVCCPFCRGTIQEDK